MAGVISDESPEIPSETEFSICIDYVRGQGEPERVFSAMHDMIWAMRDIDAAICGTLAIAIEPLLVLDEIETGSIKCFLKTVLKPLDEEALRDGEFKKVFGRYILNAKLAFLEWAEKDEEKKSIIDIQSRIMAEAHKTGIHKIPSYSRPDYERIMAALRHINDAKARLLPQEKIAYADKDDKRCALDVTHQISQEGLTQIITNKTLQSRSEMIVIVKRPDYLGQSKWDLRYGKKAIAAKIEHQEWLDGFQQRRFDVRPGDALRCDMVIEIGYGFDNEPVSETYTVMKVIEVLPDAYRQSDLFEPQ